MKAGLAALAVLVVAAAGCGGGGEAVPSEDPGTVMVTVIRYELLGRRADSWKMLVREQRRAIPSGFYTSCSPGPAVRDADVSVLGVRDELFSVPALGRTGTKAVSYRLTIRSGGSDPTVISHTGHLIAQEGHWRWTLSAGSFQSFRQGFCP
jgi:hypothetical protein